MSNLIINQDSHTDTIIANRLYQNQTAIIAPLDETLPAEAQLTPFTRSLAHGVGLGINPIVDAAAYVFAKIGKIVETNTNQNFQQLRNQLLQEIEGFKNFLTIQNYMPKYLSEYLPIATYILSTTLDDIIENTPWGGDKWHDHRLLSSYHEPILSKESFLILLERFVQDEETFIDMIEFIYICLNISFNFNAHRSGLNPVQLQKIIHSLYKRIRIYHGNFTKILSPYSLRTTQTSYLQPTWLSSPVLNFKKKINNQRVISSLSSRHPLVAQELENLKFNFDKTTAYLNGKSIKVGEKKVQLASLPWILICGASNSGKSTLLENSKIKFVLDKNKTLENLGNREQLRNWNWWVTSRSVLIDVPNSNAFMKRDQNLFVNAYWENLLDHIFQSRGTIGVNSVGLVISLSEIMDKSNHHLLIAQSVKRIIDLQKFFGNELAINLIISKCDLMHGFTEFFDDYTNEELFQPWGISVPRLISSENLANCFYKPFDILIQRLNQQVIYRLHQMRNAEFESKLRIKNFPLHLERLKENLGEVLKRVSEETNQFVLKGFYLTSAKQLQRENKSSSVSMPNKDLFETLTIMNIPENYDRSFFIKHLLLNGLVSEENNLN